MVPLEEELMGKCIKMKINKAFKWHIEGEIIDRNPELPSVNNTEYF